MIVCFRLGYWQSAIGDQGARGSTGRSNCRTLMTASDSAHVLACQPAAGHRPALLPRWAAPASRGFNSASRRIVPLRLVRRRQSHQIKVNQTKSNQKRCFPIVRGFSTPSSISAFLVNLCVSTPRQWKNDRRSGLDRHKTPRKSARVRFTQRNCAPRPFSASTARNRLFVGLDPSPPVKPLSVGFCRFRGQNYMKLSNKSLLT